MKIKQQLEDDIKTAMLAGDKLKVTTLRGLKSSILNAEVAENSRDTGLSDDKIINVFSKEAKKRQEAADLYTQAGSIDKAQAELDEKAIIGTYLPEQLSEAEVSSLIEQLAIENEITQPQQMGQLIGLVKTKSQGAVDGASVAKLVKEYLTK